MSTNTYSARAPRSGITSKDGKTRYVATFTPLPWQMAVLADMSPVLLLTGTAGGGKSRVAYEKLHAFCLRYEGASVGAFRKVRDDAQRSVVVTLEKRVIGDDPNVKHFKSDYLFEYKNGSILFYGGMKDERARTGLRSIGIEGMLDMALMEEAIEFEEQDFDEMTARMRGTTAGWTQLILATNPDRPAHFINRRLIKGGEASVHYSVWSQNPYTPELYKQSMGRMKGTTGSRLGKGLWVEGEGLVIDTWVDAWNEKLGTDGGGNVTAAADYIPDGGPVYLWIDDGYAGEWDESTKMFTDRSHPRAFLLAQLRGNGQVAVFYELYRVKVKADQQLKELREACAANGWPFPKHADYDKAAAHIEGVLKDEGFKSYNRGPASVDESIKELKSGCDADENGWRAVLVHPRCALLRLQMSSYAVDKEGRPIKAYDDGPDALRYGWWNYKRGPSRPADIATNVGQSEEVASRVHEVMARAAEIYNRLMKVS
jgi:hypothetical protein